MRSLLRLLPLVALAALMAHCSSDTSSDPGSDPIPYMKYAGGVGGAGTGTAGTTGASGSGASGGTGPVGAGPGMGIGMGGSAGMGAGGSAPLMFDITVRAVAPTDTDPAIDAFLDPHVVMVRDPLPDPKLLTRPLFVHLGKVGGQPSDGKLYMTRAALGGHLVIGLEYPNASSIPDLCANDPDPACAGDVHAELLDGVDHSKKVAISPANSITNRLGKLLAYLDKKYGNEGWGGFLANGAPDWSKMTLSGHDLGAGQAAYIARQKAATRVVMLGGPLDASTSAWLGIASATPPTAYYGFVHTMDPSYGAVIGAWTSMGLPDAAMPGQADGPPALYASKDAIVTSAAPTMGGSPHDSIAIDAATPMVSGHAIYEPVWDRLIGPN